jgi:hypothetical protein
MFKTLNLNKSMRMKLKLLSAASIIVGCGLASSAYAQSLFEGATAPTGGVILEQLVGGSDSSSFGGKPNGAPAHDYLNGCSPGELFTLGSAATLNSVTVLGNGDDGYWTGSAFEATLNDPAYSSILKWNIQIGSVSAGVITPIRSESVTGYAPVNSNDYLSFNLASPLALSAGVQYEWSMSFDLSTLTYFPSGLGSVWYGLQESLVPQVNLPNGNAFNNGIDPGQFDNTVNPAAGPCDYVFVLSNQAVPEPGTIALLSLGGLALMAFRRRA